MNISKRLVADTALVFLLATIMSCSMGLAPAKSTSDTTVSLQISDLSTYVSDRAVIPGGGFLYIQTGSTDADAKLYGPWEASSGKLFSTNEIPSGTYDSFSIIYMNTPSLNAPLVVTPDNPTILAALQSSLSDFPRTLEACSCATLSGINIRPNRINPLKATLLPATTTQLDVTSGYLMYIPSATTGMAQRFFKVSPISPISGGQVLDSFTVSLVADGTLSVSRVAVFGLDGTLIGVNDKTVTLANGLYDSWSIPCQSLRDSSCYLYIEYEGSIAASSVFYQAYANSARSVWYVSNSGGSDGSDATHPCTLAQAVECSNNTTFAGTHSIILTGPVEVETVNFTLTKSVLLSSLGESPYMIKYTGPASSSVPLFNVGDGTNAPAVSISNCTLDGGSDLTTFVHQLVDVNSGSLTLDAGTTLQNNGDTILTGGAVMVRSGTSFVMQPGSSIINCSAGRGGAVDVIGGSFTMNGGSILLCTATDPQTAVAGAVYIEQDDSTGDLGSFTMNNGVIGSTTQGCSSLKDGGAIGVIDGTFTLKGGTISGCSATNGNGGAVYIAGQNAKAVFEGGTITGCNATNPDQGHGGAVCLYSTSSVADFYASGNIARTVMTGNTAINGSILYKATDTYVRVNGSDVQMAAFLTATGYNSAAIFWQ